MPLEILTSKKLMTGAHAAGKDAACHAQRLAFGLGRLKNLRASPPQTGDDYPSASAHVAVGKPVDGLREQKPTPQTNKKLY